MPNALQLWIVSDRLDPIYAEAFGLTFNQFSRSCLIMRKDEERLKRPPSVHHVFAVDEVEPHP